MVFSLIQSPGLDLPYHQIPLNPWKWCRVSSVPGTTPRHEDNLVECHLRQSLGEVGGKEHSCFLCQVWHKGNRRIPFALTEDV